MPRSDTGFRAAVTRARDALARGLVSGLGASADAPHATAPDRSGAVVERPVWSALRHLGPSAADVDHVSAHGTSIWPVLGDHVTVTPSKGVVGYALLRDGVFRAVVSNSFGFGGQNVVPVVTPA